MMEIEFRGKRLSDGEWVYGYYLVHEPTNEHKIHFFNEKLQTMATAIVDPKTVGQYTGKVDKGGKKIYKDDWVHAWANNGKYLVTHGLYVNSEIDLDGETPDCYGWYIHQATDGDLYGDALNQSEKYLEVMGNLHDNPE